MMVTKSHLRANSRPHTGRTGQPGLVARSVAQMGVSTILDGSMILIHVSPQRLPEGE